MNKIALMKRCNLEHWIQVYMHALMYIDPEKIPEEGYFPATNCF